jgi:hypothetical protein
MKFFFHQLNGNRAKDHDHVKESLIQFTWSNLVYNFTWSKICKVTVRYVRKRTKRFEFNFGFWSDYHACRKTI